MRQKVWLGLHIDQSYLLELLIRLKSELILLIYQMLKLSYWLDSEAVSAHRERLKLTLNCNTCQNLSKVLILDAIVVENKSLEQEGLVDSPVTLCKVQPESLAYAWIELVANEWQLVILDAGKYGQVLDIFVLDAILAEIIVDDHISVILMRLVHTKRLIILVLQFAHLKDFALISDFQLLLHLLLFQFLALKQLRAQALGAINLAALLVFFLLRRRLRIWPSVFERACT